MLATDILMAQHRVIEQVLTAMETAADRLEAGLPVRSGFFDEAADFAAAYADGLHHRAEEAGLFAAMVETGMSESFGPLAALLAEHEQGRCYLRSLRAAASRLAAGDLIAAQDVAREIRRYTQLLRDHIAKEDDIFFPLANKVVSPASQQRALAVTQRVETQETGEQTGDRFTALAARLYAELAR